VAKGRKQVKLLDMYRRNYVGWNCSIGVVTCYGLDGSGIEFRWGRDFPLSSRPSLGPTQPPIPWEPGLSRGGKAAGGWL